MSGDVDGADPDGNEHGGSRDGADDAVDDPRAVARACVEAGVRAADPARAVRERVRREDDALAIDDRRYDLSAYDRVVVAGGGKAAGAIAAGLETVLGPLDGVVVTDRKADLEGVTLVRGDHPVPGERSAAGARRVREALDDADERTLVLAPVTGGGSALLAAPAGGIDLDALSATTGALVESGATIDEINAVRKHLSAVKGGRLARVASPATVAVLLVSDVVGDDPAVIASGPLVPDPTTYAGALAVLDRYGLDVPGAVRAHLEAGAAGEREESPSPGDTAFESVHEHLLVGTRTAVDAAADTARKRGYDSCVLSTRMRGEARECALAHVAVGEETLASGDPVAPPAVVLSGGEVTVTVRGEGRGGPNLELGLAAALELPARAALATVDTDGADGGTDVAGALVDADTVPADDREAARDALAGNDSYPFLDAHDALLAIDSATNVNDLRALALAEDGSEGGQ
jgi:hydroxypyruvate reductase